MWCCVIYTCAQKIQYRMILGVFKDRSASIFGSNPDNLTLPGYKDGCSVSIEGKNYYGAVIAFGNRSTFFGQIFIASDNMLFRRNADQGSHTFGDWHVVL